jgi:hypothetical protein
MRNLKSLKRRAAKLTLAMPHGLDSVAAELVPERRIPDDELDQLIADLPSGAREQAVAIVATTRDHLRTAAAADCNDYTEALLASDRIDRLANYLGLRSRRLQAESDEKLRALWRGSLRLFLDTDCRTFFLNLNHDCESELLLRGIEPPWESVRQELIEGAKLARNDPVVKMRVRDGIEKFLDRLGDFSS